MKRVVLIVRHGPGRGRMEGYCDHVLDWLASRRGDLWRCTRLYETGTGTVSLDDVAVVVFWLADPLRDWYPECYAEARAIELEAEARGLAMINCPSVLASYGKSYQTARWRQAGLRTPESVQVEEAGDILGTATAMGFPVLLRGEHAFSQRGTVILRRPSDVRRAKRAGISGSVALTPLLDTRSGYDETQPGSLWARFFHKKRAIIVGDRCVPDSLYFSRSPVVGQHTMLYGRLSARRRWLRKRGPIGKKIANLLDKSSPLHEMVKTERSFIEGPLAEEAILVRAARAIDVQFVGIDYASLADGGIVLWEANPYPFIPAANSTTLHRLRRSEVKVNMFYEAFAAYLSETIEQATAR